MVIYHLPLGAGTGVLHMLMKEYAIIDSTTLLLLGAWAWHLSKLAHVVWHLSKLSHVTSLSSPCEQSGFSM
jgi:hypothetical protein